MTTAKFSNGATISSYGYRYIGQSGYVQASSTSINSKVCNKQSLFKLKDQVKIGDFGSLSSMICNSQGITTIEETTWKVDDAKNGNIHIVFDKKSQKFRENDYIFYRAHHIHT